MREAFTVFSVPKKRQKDIKLFSSLATEQGLFHFTPCRTPSTFGCAKLNYALVTGHDNTHTRPIHKIHVLVFS